MTCYNTVSTYFLTKKTPSKFLIYWGFFMDINYLTKPEGYIKRGTL
ncbi:hypothetical protein BPUTSESOX_2240 [uncultured Gammaproteobacteria bacterium]|nr:hypothetical protein [uncultured Gammaproteobacteria bacterium]CAC9584683.1 hypothetical protein [uncultured Gammaproteobacteria bacterium]VVH51245.1 hypothetical protein BPUTSESOX_2240 [uncultured Gammaproteobacteria bacterium]